MILKVSHAGNVRSRFACLFLMTLLCGLPKVACPTTIHCDHLIVGDSGDVEDMGRATRSEPLYFEKLRGKSL